MQTNAPQEPLYPALTGFGALAPNDQAALRIAYRRLEHPSFAARLSALIGVPLTQGYKILPADWQDMVARTSTLALQRALRIAVEGLDRPPPLGRQRLRIAGLGAAGGLAGLPGLVVELPVTTVLLLQAIAAAALEEGEDLTSLASRGACLQVFALGGPRDSDDAAELGFFELRAAAAIELGAVRLSAAQTGLVAQALRVVAGRFGVVVSQKAAAQALPALGAGAGAAINLLFFQHFREVALGHFAVRRLERGYGTELVQAAYRHLQAEEAALRQERFADPEAARSPLS